MQRAGRRIGRLARQGLTVLAVAAMVAVVSVVAVAVSTGRWRIEPILSGSMRPGFPVGGVVVAERVPLSTLAVRDVVLFQPPGFEGAMDMHRVIWISRRGSVTLLRTKGDNNSVPDPWTVRLTGKTIYEARFSLPFVGYAAVWLRSGPGRRDMGLAGAGVVLALGSTAAIGARTRRRLRPRLHGAHRALTEAGGDPGEAFGAGLKRDEPKEPVSCGS